MTSEAYYRTLGEPMSNWTVFLYPDFEDELQGFSEEVQDELLARLGKLTEFGPDLGRPDVDTSQGSSFPNMKELRFQLDGIWRFAFAFDPNRHAIGWGRQER